MKRTKTLRMVFLMLLLALAGRLCYVQILCADELTAAAHSQQLIPVLQENGKGVIYDRNMTPLTGTDHAYYYLIHKDNLTTSAELLLNRMKAEPAGQKGEDYLVYRSSTYLPGTSDLLQKRHKAYGFVVDVRYGENQTAEALVTDLDEIYDGLLQKEEPVFYFLGNAAGGLIHGTGVNRGMTGMTAGKRGGESTSLVTTIDAELQKEIEEMFEAEGAIGCAVVTDTRNGQVLTMASRNGEAQKAVDGGTAESAMPNLAVEQAYPLGKTYRLIQDTATIIGRPAAEAAALLGLGEPVFAAYPDEDVGILAGRKTTATAVQMSQILTTLANGGKAVLLTFIMSNVKEESLPCMELTGETAAKLEKLQRELTEKPVTGDGWAAGYEGAYGITVYCNGEKEERIYTLVEKSLLAD